MKLQACARRCSFAAVCAGKVLKQLSATQQDVNKVEAICYTCFGNPSPDGRSDAEDTDWLKSAYVIRRRGRLVKSCVLIGQAMR